MRFSSVESVGLLFDAAIAARAMKGEKRSGRGVANVTAAKLKSDPAAGEQNIFVCRLVVVGRFKGNESSNC